MTVHAPDPLMSTGDLASITGLSLRSIRYYEEVGLVPAVGRSKGGNRKYDKAALDRLLMIMKMKPLDFSLEEMATLLTTLDEVRDQALGAEARGQALAKLATFSEVVDQRWQWLQERLTIAEQFRAQLRAELTEPSRSPAAGSR